MRQIEPLEPTPRDARPTEEAPTPGMQIVRKTSALAALEKMAEGVSGNLVKAVVEIEQGSVAVAGESTAESLGAGFLAFTIAARRDR
jgi:hypothetical protein